MCVCVCVCKSIFVCECACVCVCFLWKYEIDFKYSQPRGEFCFDGEQVVSLAQRPFCNRFRSACSETS